MKIFLDSGSPEDTKEALLSFPSLSGQTTNPSLVAKHPEVSRCRADGVSCTEEMVLRYYKEIVHEIISLIPGGSVSVEVHVEDDTTAEEMIDQARIFAKWGETVAIKLPITNEGLKAARVLSKEGIDLNLTLCFSQSQAAAVHSATAGGGGRVFVSPFIGRLEDQGVAGVDLVQNISRMYREQESRVEVLAASIRNKAHIDNAEKAGADIVTAPLPLLKNLDEGETDTAVDDSFNSVVYEELSLSLPWHQYDISHPLTDAGLRSFADDWNSLIDN